MPYELVHAVVLTLVILMAFVLSRTSLVAYDLQISAVLFIMLFLSKRLSFPPKSLARLIEASVFTFIIIFITNSTGGPASPFFFLIYFLLFAMSLLLEPVIPIVMSLGLIVFYVISMPGGQGIGAFMPIFALALLTPFALLLGQEYIKLRQEDDKLVQTQQRESGEKEQSLLFLSLIVKNHVKHIEDAVDNFNGDHELHVIRKQAHEIKKLIDAYEKTIS